jgi:hypothetical protein
MKCAASVGRSSCFALRAMQDKPCLRSHGRRRAAVPEQITRRAGALEPRYWYAAFTIRVSSSVGSLAGLSDWQSAGFVTGAAGFGLVIDLTPGTVISRRPTFTRSPVPGRRLFLIMRNPAVRPTPSKSRNQPARIS